MDAQTSNSRLHNSTVLHSWRSESIPINNSEILRRSTSTPLMKSHPPLRGITAMIALRRAAINCRPSCSRINRIAIATVTFFMALSWSSPSTAVPGGEWQITTSTTSMRGRTWFGTAIFNEKMWLFGGANDSPLESPVVWDDAWFSPDGSAWTWIHEAHANACGQNGLVLDGKLWAIGAGESHWTLDGNTWTDIGKGIGSFYRAEAVFAGKMWLLGGKTYNSEGGELYLNNSYSSVDGSNWSRRSAPWRQFGGVMALV